MPVLGNLLNSIADCAEDLVHGSALQNIETLNRSRQKGVEVISTITNVIPNFFSEMTPPKTMDVFSAEITDKTDRNALLLDAANVMVHLRPLAAQFRQKPLL